MGCLRQNKREKDACQAEQLHEQARKQAQQELKVSLMNLQSSSGGASSEVAKLSTSEVSICYTVVVVNFRSLRL